MDIALLINDPKEYYGSVLATYCNNWGSQNNGLAAAYKKALDYLGEECKISYLYFGSEFCEYCIPNTSMLHNFLEICKKDKLTPVFVTPPSSDYGVKKLEEDLLYLKKELDLCEIVINDLGILELVHDICPHYIISIGRIFDKTSHDSRILSRDIEAYYGQDGLRFARTPGILSNSTERILCKYNVVRYEFDFPKVGLEVNGNSKYSLHFPYQYLTTGRVCLFRATQYKDQHKFLVGSEKCCQICTNIQAELRKPVNGFVVENGRKISDTYLFQRGNTIFYINESEDLFMGNTMFDRLIIQ
jgi:hypothetical protein